MFWEHLCPQRAVAEFWLTDPLVDLDADHLGDDNYHWKFTPRTRMPSSSSSGVARAWVAHPESQNEEENEKSLRKNKKNDLNLRQKWGKWNSCPPGTVRLATALVSSSRTGQSEFCYHPLRMEKGFSKMFRSITWVLVNYCKIFLMPSTNT